MNPWDNDPVAPANDPSFTGYIPGVPKPKDNITWRTLTKAEAQAAGLDTGMTWQQSSAGETKKVGDAGDPQKDVLGDAARGLGIDELIANVGKARSAIKGGYATGITGGLLSHVPGTSAADFRGYIDAIQGGVILEKLQALKEASKTGASGLGALSEKEGERLAASVAAIKPNMSDQALQESLDAIEQHANFLRAVADGKDPRDPNVAKQYKLTATPPAAPPTGRTTNEPPPPGFSEMTPEQQAKDKAFLATNPSPDQYNSFVSELLNRPMDAQASAARLKAAKAGGSYSGAVDETAALRKRIAEEDKLGIGESAGHALGMQGATLNLSDEASGVGNALAGIVASPFTEKFDPVGDYRVGREMERLRIEDARKQLGYGGTAIEFAGALASGNPAAALETLAPKAAAIAAGKGGAAGGALAGYGAGEGTDQSIVGMGGGALGGYALGRYGGTVLNKVLPRRFQAPQGMAPELADAAKAENVDLIRPMVDPHSRSDYGALESNIYSQPIIRGAEARVRGQIEDRVGALGGDGTAAETGAAGDIVQGAGRRFIQRSKRVADTLYNRARDLAGDQRFVPQQAIDQVDSEISSLSANKSTNTGEIRFLEGLKEDLSTPGGKTVEELRQLRTSLRGRVAEQNLGATQAEARAIRAMDATQQDVAGNVPAAASAYRRADSFYRERQTHIDDIIKRITGGKVGATDFQVSSERAFARLKAMASPGGDGRRLAALMRDLEPSERQDIAATIAQGLGRKSSDEPFSTALFVSQTSKLSPSARRTIFGPDGAQSIENLRLLSRKLEEAGKDINRSRSATVLERQGIRTAARAFIAGIAGLGGHVALGGIEGGVAGIGVAGAAMGASASRRVLSARAMVNPRVSRWLAESADASTPAQAQEATRKLGVIIAREPALAHELKPIYDTLTNRLSSPTALPLAAQSTQGTEADNEQQ